MKIDLHCHVKLTKKLDFQLEYFNQAIHEASLAGLNAIAMTEHFNTRNFYEIYEQLDAAYPYKENYYDVNGFKVFPGMEIDVDQLGHILVVGTRRKIIDLRNRLEPFTEKGSFVPFKQLLDWCDELELLRIGAHPHRESNPITQHDVSLLARLDAFDINGKDIATYGPTMVDQVMKLANEVGIPVVVGSDTHHPLQFGCVHNLLEGNYTSYEQIRSYIKENRHEIIISPSLPLRVKAATLVKKLLKERGNTLLPTT